MGRFSVRKADAVRRLEKEAGISQNVARALLNQLECEISGERGLPELYRESDIEGLIKILKKYRENGNWESTLDLSRKFDIPSSDLSVILGGLKVRKRKKGRGFVWDIDSEIETLLYALSLGRVPKGIPERPRKPKERPGPEKLKEEYVMFPEALERMKYKYGFPRLPESEFKRILEERDVLEENWVEIKKLETLISEGVFDEFGYPKPEKKKIKPAHKPYPIKIDNHMHPQVLIQRVFENVENPKYEKILATLENNGIEYKEKEVKCIFDIYRLLKKFRNDGIYHIDFRQAEKICSFIFDGSYPSGIRNLFKLGKISLDAFLLGAYRISGENIAQKLLNQYQRIRKFLTSGPVG